MPVPELLERERVVELLERVATAAAREGRGATVLVHGAPGSGRTAVLGVAASLAAAAGMRVRRWTCAEDETAAPLAVATALLGDAATLPWERVAVDAVAGGPCALVVDDLERADPGSLRLLGALTRRAADVPLVVIAATADGPAGHAVRRALAGAEDARLDPLSSSASARVVARMAPGAGPAAAAACHAAGGGLPFYVAALAEHAAAGSQGQARTGAGEDPVGRAGAVGDAIRRRVADRLGALDDAPRALALALAVLGDDATWPLAGALAGLDGPSRRAAADALRLAALLDRGADPVFAPPVLGAAVAAAALPGALASAHRRAAELLARDGAPPERLAAHLARAEPDGDPWVSATLRDAGRDAMERRAPEAAIAHLRRALEEPPPAAERAAVLTALGVAETVAFRTADAVEHLRAATELAGSLAERLEASVALVAVLTQAGDPERDLGRLLGALDQVGDRRAREQLEAHIVNQARQRTSMHLATRDLAQAIAARVDADPATASAAELAAAAAELTMAGTRSDEAARLAAAVLARAPDPDPMRSTSIPVAIRCLAAADHLDEAAAFVDAALADGRARNAALEVTMLSVFRSDVALRAGDLAVAERTARDAWSGGSRESWSLGHPATTATLLLALLARGEIAEAETVLATSGFAGAEEPDGDLYTSAMLLHARGALRIALGQAAAGIADLRSCGRRLTAHGEPNPALIPWRSELAVALGGDGGIALAEEELRLARTFGAPRAIAIALGATALLDD
ncbi:MAG: hypothetical protein QOF26_3672, partial [Baekduia sp.]|nr:hypothetical protein [Baekduia sp.]